MIPWSPSPTGRRHRRTTWPSRAGARVAVGVPAHPEGYVADHDPDQRATGRGQLHPAGGLHLGHRHRLDLWQGGVEDDLHQPPRDQGRNGGRNRWRHCDQPDRGRVTQCQAEVITLFLDYAALKYILESFKDYLSATAQSPDPACPTVNCGQRRDGAEHPGRLPDTLLGPRLEPTGRKPWSPCPWRRAIAVFFWSLDRVRKEIASRPRGPHSPSHAARARRASAAPGRGKPQPAAQRPAASRR